MPSFFLPQQQKQQRDVERMKSVAQAMRDYGVQTPNEMVSGIVVKKSPIEALAKALGTAGAGYYEGKARRTEDDLAAQRNAQLASVLSGGSPELQQLAAIDPQLALKTYADDIKRTNEMKNAAASGYGTPLDYLSASKGIEEGAKAGYDLVDVPLPDGTVRKMTREQAVRMTQPNAPLSVRNNNPFNLRPTGQGQGFQQFQNPEEGMQAGLRDLSQKIAGRSPIMQERYGQGYTPTLENLISTWAPPSENDTQNYINTVSQATGIDPKQPLTQDDLKLIAPAMIEMEGGNKASQYYQPQMAGFEVKAPTSPESQKLNEDFISGSYRPSLEQAEGARQANARIEAVKNIDLTGNTGWGTETRAAAANVLTSLGLGGEEAQRLATDAQTFKSIVSKQVNEELMLQKGPQTEGDAQRAFNIQAQLGNTPQANEFILDLAQATNNQKINKAKFFAENVGKPNMYQLENEWQNQAQSVFDDPIMAKYKNIQQNYEKSVAQNNTKTIGDKTYINIGGQWFEQ